MYSLAPGVHKVNGPQTTAAPGLGVGREGQNTVQAFGHGVPQFIPSHPHSDQKEGTSISISTAGDPERQVTGLTPKTPTPHSQPHRHHLGLYRKARHRRVKQNEPPASLIACKKRPQKKKASQYIFAECLLYSFGSR